MDLLRLAKSANPEHGDALDCCYQMLSDGGSEDSLRCFARKLLDGILEEEPVKYVVEVFPTPEPLRAHVREVGYCSIKTLELRDVRNFGFLEWLTMFSTCN